ncbi:uncharacterized protein LOC129256443 [Lytechinus pictus]|uniref:uncharacterized protein LOC129256443 n=1 Tax=Lytechinus pictus TaxID=7653 RepID=UPI00240D05BE|nr:uncharacterized protein LOC129256443 [Lytechinus pictus]
MKMTAPKIVILVAFFVVLLSACSEGRRKMRPNKDKNASPGRRCPGNQEWTNCGYCQNLVCGIKMPACPRRCFMDCRCPRGQRLLSEDSDMCVEESRCPSPIDANITE